MKFYVFILLLWYIGLFQSIPIINRFFFYSTIILGFIFFIRALIEKKQNKWTIAIFLFCIIFPIISSIQAHRIWDQPIYMGLLSLRYSWTLYFGFLLIYIKYPYHILIKQINILSFILALISIYVFYFNGSGLLSEIFVYGEDGFNAINDNIKGKKVGLFAYKFIYISIIYYLISFMRTPGSHKNLFFFLFYIFYLIIIAKARQLFVLICIVYLIEYFRNKKFTVKKLLLSLIPILTLGVMLIFSNDFINSYTIAFSSNNTDASSAVRVQETLEIIPYIKEHLLMGVGNLSFQYKDGGFQHYFGEHFYISDLGIRGTLFKGGLFLIIIYLFLYKQIYSRTKIIQNKDLSDYLLSIIIPNFILWFAYLDIFIDIIPFLISILFYPIYLNPLNYSTTFSFNRK